MPPWRTEEEYTDYLRRLETIKFYAILGTHMDTEEETKMEESKSYLNDIKNIAEPTNKPAEDRVNHPSHYADHCSIECFDAMKLFLGNEGTLYFCMGNAFKYLWRCDYKGGEEDLDKAAWYIHKAYLLNDAISSTDQRVLEQLDSLHELLCLKKGVSRP